MPQIPVSKEIIDIPDTDMFASGDWRVINRAGENYYLSCGEVVYTNSDGSTSHCVKPSHHITWEHEDFDGNIRFTSFNQVSNIDQQVRDRARAVLKHTGLSEEQVYNALNALYFDGINLVKEP